MAISPFGARPVSPHDERGRTRLVIVIATIGIAATLLAYAVSPGVRHAVGHAAHSVKRAVSHVLDRDATTRAHAKPRAAGPPRGAARAKRTSSTSTTRTTTRAPAGVP